MGGGGEGGRVGGRERTVVGSVCRRETVSVHICVVYVCEMVSEDWGVGAAEQERRGRRADHC